MQRDRDEWRRPWTAGAGTVPPLGAAPGAPADAGPDAAAETRLVAGWDAAYDRVDDLEVGADRSGTFGRADLRQPAPTVAPPTGRTSTPVAAAAPAPRRRGTTLLTAVVAGAAGAAVTLAAVGLPSGDVAEEAATPAAVDTAASAAPAPAPTRPTIDPTRDVIPQVADLVTPSVVRIDVRGGAALQGEALGSGVIYRSDGYIVTNNHVIESGTDVSVTLATGGQLPAEIVGTDVLNDLAVLRIDADGLPAVAIRPESEPLLVGETVVAIGSPFGLDASVTAGIVSALNRDLPIPGTNDRIPAVLQTDAAINPGNSGGALVDLEGRLVGINTAIFSRTGSNEGIGFAVTSSQAVSSAEQLIRQGFVRYPLLGITGTDVSEEVATAFGLPDRRGAVVESVQDGSGADAAGMLPGDVIVAVDGAELTSMSQLVAEVRRRAPGDVVRFGIVRDGQRLELAVTLGERPRD
jgi:S1-C subfamily serine protease